MVAVTAQYRAKTPAKRRRKSWTWITLSSVAISAVFVGQYAQGSLEALAQDQLKVGPVPAYVGHGPVILAAFYCHVICAGIALAIGPFQFARWLRTRYPRMHRWIGRTYMISVLLGSVSSFVMAFFNSVGIGGFFGFAALAVLWGWTAWRGYRAAREKKFREHQSWMIRNFAMTYAAVTLRLWLGVLILVQLPFLSGGGFVELFTAAYAPLPYIAWIPNVIVAEFIIRRRGLPALRMTTGNLPPRNVEVRPQVPSAGPYRSRGRHQA